MFQRGRSEQQVGQAMAQTKNNINESLLVVSNLCVKEEATGLELLQQVSFELLPGQIVGLVGESGSGKTLTCRSILQLLSEGMKMSGSMRLKDKELVGLKEAEIRKLRGKEIGYITQNPMGALVPVRTIGSQFLETLRTHLGLSKREALMVSEQSLEKLGLENAHALLQRYPFELSGGMLQRVLIALTLCLSPSIVIADEPTTALDTVNQYRVLQQLELLRAETGSAILLITHDLDVIAELADHVLVMQDGRIVEKSDVFSLFASPQHPYTQQLLEHQVFTGGMN